MVTSLEMALTTEVWIVVSDRAGLAFSPSYLKRYLVHQGVLSSSGDCTQTESSLILPEDTVQSHAIILIEWLRSVQYQEKLRGNEKRLRKQKLARALCKKGHTDYQSRYPATKENTFFAPFRCLSILYDHPYSLLFSALPQCPPCGVRLLDLTSLQLKILCMT
jgi:hypothetical protein